MTPITKLYVNGVEHSVTAEAATPLLYILRDDLKLQGTRFGCGLGRFGACNVLLEDRNVQSCDLPLTPQCILTAMVQDAQDEVGIGA